MPIEQAISTIVEFGVTRALNSSVNGWSLVKPLIGKRCVLHAQEPHISLAFSFQERSVEVISVQALTVQDAQEYFDTIPDNECYVSVSVFAINELKKTSQLTKLIKQGKLDFYGDLGIVQNVSRVFADIEFDIEETLSSYIGDAQAYNMVAQTSQWRKHFERQTTSFTNMLADAALDEKPIAVRPIMVAHYVDEVRQLKMDTERFEARISKFAKRLGNHQDGGQ